MRKKTTKEFLKEEITQHSYDVTVDVNNRFRYFRRNNIEENTEAYLYLMRITWIDDGTYAKDSIKYYGGYHTGPIDSLLNNGYVCSSTSVLDIIETETVYIEYYILETGSTQLMKTMERIKLKSVKAKSNADFLNKNEGGGIDIMPIELFEDNAEIVYENTQKPDHYPILPFNRDVAEKVEKLQYRYSTKKGDGYTDPEHIARLVIVVKEAKTIDDMPLVHLLMDENDEPKYSINGHHSLNAYLQCKTDSPHYSGVRQFRAMCIPHSDWKDFTDMDFRQLSNLLNPRPEVYTLPTTNESLAYALSEIIKTCNIYTHGDKSLPNTGSPIVAKFYATHKIKSPGVKSAISKMAKSILEGNTDADGDFFGYWGTKTLKLTENIEYKNRYEEMEAAVRKKCVDSGLYGSNIWIIKLSNHDDITKRINKKFIFDSNGDIDNTKMASHIHFFFYYVNSSEANSKKARKKLMAKYEFYREALEQCHGITMSFEFLPWKKSKMNIKKSNLDNIISIEEVKEAKVKNA